MKKIILLLLSIYLFASCGNYKTVFVEPKEFLENEDVKLSFNRYSIVVHDKNGKSYQLENASISGDSINGDIKPIVADTTEKRKAVEANEVHLFINKELDSAKTKTSNTSEKITFTKQELASVQTSAKDEASLFSKIGLIVLGVLGALLLLYATLALIIYASGKAAESSSDGSNSNSNSDSGSQDSGEGSNASSDGSNASSDGSNSSSDGSNSGCFIATMAYGSYTAPEVMKFRQYRDQHLSKNQIGKRFIAWYYTYSPQFVAKYSNKKWAHILVKTALTPLLCILKLRYKA